MFPFDHALMQIYLLFEESLRFSLEPWQIYYLLSSKKQSLNPPLPSQLFLIAKKHLWISPLPTWLFFIYCQKVLVSYQQVLLHPQWSVLEELYRQCQVYIQLLGKFRLICCQAYIFYSLNCLYLLHSIRFYRFDKMQTCRILFRLLTDLRWYYLTGCILWSKPWQQ